MNNKFEIARLRRRASKLGYKVESSRRRRGSINNLGGYMLVDSYGNYCVAGADYDLSATDVADWLDHLEAA